MEYNGSEILLKQQFDSLHDKWRSHLINSIDDIEKRKLIPELYIPDGFYPEYTRQKFKILFIGKEGLQLWGNDYLEKLFEAYHNKYIGDIDPTHINRYQFHYTMIYIAYALQNGIYKWEDIPWASEIVDNFGIPGGFSFAFMNLSKFSNESGNWKADEELIDTFLRLSQNPDYDFFAQAVNILDPNLIISMNLEDRMKYMGKFSDFKRYGKNEMDVCFQTITTSIGKEYTLLDTWHFSAPCKSPKIDIFERVMEALRDNKII